MMNRQQWLLGKLAEEATEVGKRALKAQQFGLDEVQPSQDLNNAERLVMEVYDLINTYEIFCEEYDTGMPISPGRPSLEARRAKMAKFLELSRQQKMVA